MDSLKMNELEIKKLELEKKLKILKEELKNTQTQIKQNNIQHMKTIEEVYKMSLKSTNHVSKK